MKATRVTSAAPNVLPNRVTYRLGSSRPAVLTQVLEGREG